MKKMMKMKSDVRMWDLQERPICPKVDCSEVPLEVPPSRFYRKKLYVGETANRYNENFKTMPEGTWKQPMEHYPEQWSEHCLSVCVRAAGSNGQNIAHVYVSRQPGMTARILSTCMCPSSREVRLEYASHVCSSALLLGRSYERRGSYVFGKGLG